jgi:hypothetical protein
MRAGYKFIKTLVADSKNILYDFKLAKKEKK